MVTSKFLKKGIYIILTVISNFALLSFGQENYLIIDSLDSDFDKNIRVYELNKMHFSKKLILFPDSSFEFTYDKCGTCDVSWGSWRIENDSILILRSNFSLSDSLLVEKRKNIEWYNYRDYKPLIDKRLVLKSQHVYELDELNNFQYSLPVKKAKSVSFRFDTVGSSKVICTIQFKGVGEVDIHSIETGELDIHEGKTRDRILLQTGMQSGIVFTDIISTSRERGEWIQKNEIIGSVKSKFELLVMYQIDDGGIEDFLKTLKTMFNNK